ncbi:hypothetical protein ABFS82_14G115100 [Erythranthe guttata]|uniref:uncharacterized protein LOC105952050 n=1 Tax=Erythranthe guttata TaxID=4155 RepID=UPI00064E0DE8|nr:PREDICTED: uncharacterized protein LOC105952050 [Erythranthe guttata]|eukprot:XP_012831009.1 PREDICTED: uncharacterized protein LOC105952050 [Erythranthe guttata]
MDTFNNFQDIRVEKANAVLRYRRIRKITALFRFVELFVFLVTVSRFCSQFASSVKLSAGEYFSGISIALISPRFVFLVGNAIVIVLFFKSGRFSTNNNSGGEKTADFYDEYVAKCWRNPQSHNKLEEKKACDARGEGMKIQRSHSENQMMHVDERRRQLRRSVTERCRKNSDCGRKLVSAEANRSSYEEDGMSGEEFRRTVEAFIARQQRCLREEEDDFTAAVSIN